ncbi:MAG TPA: hypothetical protein VGG83_00210 [Trebonia sp.]
MRQTSWPEIERHRDYIYLQLADGVTAATIHQRLRDERGLGASVASVRRWIRGNLPEEDRRDRVRVLRPDAVDPGAEAQVDYGKTPLILMNTSSTCHLSPGRALRLRSPLA